MPQIKSHYRIDHKVGGVWEPLNNMHESVSARCAESFYEDQRNKNPEVELRLVQVTEHCERSGKGRVYL